MSRTQIYFSNAYIRASGFDAGGLANEGGTWNPYTERIEEAKNEYENRCMTSSLAVTEYGTSFPAKSLCRYGITTPEKH